MSNDTETQTSQSIEERSPSRGNSSPSSPPSSTTATAAQPHKQSKHKFRHEAKPVSPLPPIQECTLSECIALLRLENSPTGSSPSSAVGDASGDASASQEPASNNSESSSTPSKASSVGASNGPLDCFLTEALRNHQHRLFILRLERDFSQFLDQTSLDSMELPWINSFYRMMIHRVANCFQLERRIDTTQKTITLYRTDQSALPAFRFVDIHHEEAEEEEGEEEEETPVLTPTATTVKPIKVLKRCPPRPASVCGGRSSSSSRADDSNQRTVSIKEREEAYAKARARIFQGTEVSHSPSLSSSSSSSPRPQLSRSKTVAEPANESNTDETSTVVGSDNGTVMASPMSPGSSTKTYHHDGSFSVHQRGRSSDTSESFAGYSPTQPYSGHFYGDPSRRTSAPSLGAHVTHRQVVPGARHFVQGSDGVIRYDPTIDISPQQPPPRPHQGSTKGTYSLQGQDQYTHPSHEVYLHHPPHIQHPQLPQHHHYPGHHHDQACPIVRQHSAPETYMTKDQLMCPFVQQHLQQHHNHHHHIPHPTHLHHAPPPSQQHLYPPHHRPPPRQATYPVYGIISAPPPQTQHQGSPRQGHHGVGAYPMDLYPCSCMHHEGYSPDMGSIAPGFGHHPTPPPPHSHPQPVSPMRPSGGSQQSARARMPSTRGGSDGGGIQLPSYPVYDVDKRPPKSTELYDPKNPKCTTRKRG